MNYLDIWCFQAAVSFGYVEITPKQKSMLPLARDQDCQEVYQPHLNCEVLAPGFHVSWSVTETMLKVKLQSQIGEGDYMAFGISGSTSASFMEGGDVVVAFYDSTPHAIDYFLQRGFLSFPTFEYQLTLVFPLYSNSFSFLTTS